jgi:hypothetical protein
MTMGDLAAVMGSRADAHSLAVSKRFGRYKDEEEKAVRSSKVVEDRVLGQLKEAWMKVHLGDELGPACLRAIKGIQYSAKDVEKFSVALVEFQDEVDFATKAGVFLSALVDSCRESEFIIRTRHLYGKIHFLGLHNTKNITIDGDAGHNLGLCMNGGRITVEGTGGWAGRSMENGEIVINGGTGTEIGYSMTGGKITVKGNADARVGQGMCGGEIRLEGGYESLGWDQKGGKVYHKGKIIHPTEGQK